MDWSEWKEEQRKDAISKFEPAYFACLSLSLSLSSVWSAFLHGNLKMKDGRRASTHALLLCKEITWDSVSNSADINCRKYLVLTELREILPKL